MGSSEAAILSPAFIRNMASRREGLAHEWYIAISAVTSLIHDRPGAIHEFSELTNRIIAFLTDPTQAEQEARDIGESLAALHCIQPSVIEITWKLWTQHVLELARPAEFEILGPRLVTLMYALTTGYMERAGEIVLSEQEQIRQALVFQVEKISQELREHQLHLEETLAERTEELHAKEQQYRLITETSMLGIVQLDWAGVFTYANPAFCKLVGYAAEEIVGRSFAGFVNPDDVPEMRARRLELKAAGVITTDRDWIRRDGYPVHTVTRLARIEAHNEVLITAFVEDVTNQRQMEEALRASEALYRTLAEASNDLINLVNPHGEIAYANSSSAKQFGVAPRDLIGKRLADFFPPHITTRQLGNIQKAHESGQPLQVEAPIDFGDKILWLSTWLLPIKDNSDQADSVLVVSRDITEHKQLEDTLRQRAATLRALIDNTADAIWSIDTEYRLTTTNATFREAMAALVGREPKNGESAFTALPQALVDEWTPLYARALAGEAFSRVGIAPGGLRGPVYLETAYNPILGLDDKVVGVACFSHDITEKKRTDDVLRASEERYRTLADSALDLILTIDREHQITYINPFASAYLGARPDQVTGRPSSVFFLRESGQVLEDAIDSVFRSGNDMRLEEQVELPSGWAWLSLSLVPLRDVAGSVDTVFILAKDVSNLKRSEVALLLAKRELEERVLERTATLAASQKRSRDLARQVITAQEEERRRLARELHDQSGQALIAIEYQMDSILKELPKDLKLARRGISKVTASIDQTLQQIRGISQELRPPILDVAGNHLSLKEFCSDLAEKTSLAIEYEGSELPGLDSEIGISLFRIVQELLTNVLKHAEATAATVRLARGDDAIVLEVHDNGKGIKNRSANAGLGLLGIQERLDILGGQHGSNFKKRARHQNIRLDSLAVSAA